MPALVRAIIVALNTDEGVSGDVYSAFYDIVRLAINDDAAALLNSYVNATDNQFYLKSEGPLDIANLMRELYSYASDPVTQ